MRRVIIIYDVMSAVCAFAERRHAKTHSPHDPIRVRRRTGHHGEIRDAERRAMLQQQHARRLEQVRIACGHVGDGFGRTIPARPHRHTDQRTGRVLHAGGALRQSDAEKRHV